MNFAVYEMINETFNWISVVFGIINEILVILITWND